MFEVRIITTSRLSGTHKSILSLSDVPETMHFYLFYEIFNVNERYFVASIVPCSIKS